MRLTRRQWLGGLGATGLLAGRLTAAEPKPRLLDIQVEHGGFGEASDKDILAVVTATGQSIWKHCPHTEFQMGLCVFHREEGPITVTQHAADGRVRIGLSVEGTYWAQCVYQFGHEFCHALAGHTNDWKKCWTDLAHANKWLEESLCESASLFALRALGESWASEPPYPNWKSFAPKLTEYAGQRLDDPLYQLPAGKSFAEWFKAEERSLRKDPMQRAKNTLIARQLLPLFEATPAGWEALAALNLVERDAKKDLAKQFADWTAAAGADQNKFLARLAAVFGVALG